MKLQTKLTLSFGLAAVITLAVAVVGYWQTEKLAAALYEVGAVRLPSIQGLDAISEGMTAIRAAERLLLVPGLDEATVMELVEQERRAWVRVDRGWKLYEPLPQTPEENGKWSAFVPVWRHWQAEHQAVMDLAFANRLHPNVATLARAQAQSRIADRLAREAASLLAEITAINETVAAQAKKDSVSSLQDMHTVQYLMIGTAVAGFATAIALGIFLGRLISRPMEKMSRALGAIERGDLNVNVLPRSSDEIGQATQAMNSMVEALRNARATVRVVSDNLPDCLLYQMVREPGGSRRFLYVSAGIERLHGLTAEAVLRDPALLYNRVLPADRETLEAAELASMSSMTVFNVEVRMQLPSGEMRWRRLFSQPQRLPDGRVEWHGIELDITEQRQAEETLRVSEERFRLLVTNSTVGMLMFTREGQNLEVNSALSNILGYSREELLKIGFITEVTHPDDRAKTLHYQARMLAEEIDSFDWEKRYIRKDGQVIWAHVHVSRMHETQGRETNFLAQIQDINARKLAEESLMAATKRLKLALQASRLGVWHRDLQTGVVEWDDRVGQIIGQENLVRQTTQEEVLAWVIPEDRPVLVAAREQLLSVGFYDIQLRFRRPSGELRHVGIQTMLQRDAAGQPHSTIGVMADLTDLVHTVEESGRLREKLRQAQKMETLGTLAAGIAHDFNNLLTGINGFVELGVSTLPPEHEAVEMLRQARLGATSARDLVRRILDFSRRVPDPERTVVQLADFVRDSAPLITAGLPDQVTLSFAMEENTPPVRADSSQVQQVLMNLCVNGAHAIGDRGGTIRISIGVQVFADELALDAIGRPIKAGTYTCLAVADTGCGMSPEVCARIFEPFYTTKQAGVGTGLGLSVVQDVVVDHDGYIRVQSEPGRGTTFEVLLPANMGIAAAVLIPKTGPAARGQGERVLVVDDEPSIAAVARRALTDAGYVPEVFGSAQEAWAQFVVAPDRYALLLVDHQMPDLTGAEFAARARQLSASLPIVLMTGRMDDVAAAELQRLGRIDLLAKPFSLEELLTRVAASLHPPASTPLG